MVAVDTDEDRVASVVKSLATEGAWVRADVAEEDEVEYAERYEGAGGESDLELPRSLKPGAGLKEHQRHGVAWRDIYEANMDVIGDNPDLIKPGQKLRIPR